MVHGRPDELAKSREDARLRKLGERERRKPPRAWYEEGWNRRPFRPVLEVVERFGVDRSTVTRWQAWTVHEDAKAKAVFDVPRPEGLPPSHFDWTTEHIPLLIGGFLEFREKYFTTERGGSFISPRFQQSWASAVLTAKVTGGKKMILAPQRHGKTRLLGHFCIYLFCLDPNIRVLWVSVTQGIAEKSVELMRGIFEGNERLIRDYAGPGETFQPALRSLHKWTNSEFTLATRENMEIPGANIKALGRGGSILSLNADIIIVDDIDDDGSTSQFGTREKTKQWWFTQLQSRKEEHTGLFVIGSRQHADDLYSQILTEPGWDITVEQAHNPACGIPKTEFAAHTDCMLFPEVRSFRWLELQRLSAKSPAHFEMIYQNVARSAGLVVFPEEDLFACRSVHYKAGTMPSAANGGASPEGGIRLVGGLDPAISGFQAAVLLAYQTQPELKVWLVDLDNTEGGGVGAAASIMRKWRDTYGLMHWRWEDNLLGEHRLYQEITEVIQQHGLHVENWHTGHNKNNQFFGVTSLAAIFRERQIVLPYGEQDAAGRLITDTLISQLAIWDEGNSRNKNRTGFKDDLVMALWFAWDPIRRARQDFNVEMGVDYTPSFPWYQNSEADLAPWTRTG
jgi:hypothetical protein